MAYVVVCVVLCNIYVYVGFVVYDVVFVVSVGSFQSVIFKLEV